MKSLQSALRAVRAMRCDDSKDRERKEQLERQISLDMTKVREELELKTVEWI